MTTLEESIQGVVTPHLRPLDLTRDLDQVADLIEACFSPQMDPDGKEYLRQMRRFARDAYLLRRTIQATASPYSPLGGFVWEENERVVGNLSLIPSSRLGKRIYLIANVAVYDNYRRRGIGRALTQAAINRSRQLEASACWLQVREDNANAIHLYRSLGFVERARRTAWLAWPDNSPSRRPFTEATLSARLSTDWTIQKPWLSRIYPSEVSWNLSLDVEKFRPGLWNALGRFLAIEDIRHWAARIDDNPIGFLTWQTSRSFADALWLATHPEYEEQAILSLLPYVRRAINSTRPFSVNYPTGHATDAFLASGFRPHQTLIWMELPFTTTIPIIQQNREA